MKMKDKDSPKGCDGSETTVGPSNDIDEAETQLPTVGYVNQA